MTMENSNARKHVLIAVISISLIALLTACSGPKSGNSDQGIVYEPNWNSLAQWTVPEWFNDAVVGYYCHWGVYSVPGFEFEEGPEVIDSGLWYGGWMYVPNDAGIESYGVHDHHVATYGDPGEFGYHEFVPMFTAENWDPDEWITLFKHAGADFAGIAGEHGEGFVLWDSEFDKFNAMDKGPKRDILGDLFEAARKQGLRTVVSFHEPPAEMFEFARTYYPDGEGVNDPEYQDLYGTSSFDVLNKKLLEVVDKYQPDQIWFEDKYCGRENWKEFIAYYYNEAQKWGREVFISQKADHAPLSCSVFDIEGGIFPEGNWEWAGMEEPQAQRWQKDVPIGRYWAYAEGVGCRPVNMLVDGIVDRISKNGVTMFNVSPKPDGTLPEEQVQGLTELGNWMQVNREALHAARPAPFHEGGIDAWEAGTIRFTEKENYVYAIEMGNNWPSQLGFDKHSESIKPQAPYRIPGVRPDDGSEVMMLGHGEPLPWHMEGEDLVIESLPETLPCEHAWSFRIRMTDESVTRP
jgi:alpha-L-fucosidase